MAVTPDILASYRSPRTVIRRIASGPMHEGRALAYLFFGCLMVFIAQLPRLSREAALDPARDIAERASGEVLVWMIIAPLVFYILAALAHLVAKLFGGKGDWYGARLATFWALLAAAPLWLLRGLVAGFIGPSLLLQIVTLLALVGYGWLWVQCLRETETAPAATDPQAT